jgi:quercetin dioxygenase-like cupin family protein
VERFSFGVDAAFTPRDELLEGVTIAPLTQPVSLGSPVQAAVFRFAPGGRIARHQTTVPQILAVLEGSGEVSGANGIAEAIAAGEAVFLAEDHDVSTRDGLTALIVEGEGLEPFRGPNR